MSGDTSFRNLTQHLVTVSKIKTTRDLSAATSGSAARCEAGLRPAVETLLKGLGYAPGSAFGPSVIGQSPNQGRSPAAKLT